MNGRGAAPRPAAPAGACRPGTCRPGTCRTEAGRLPLPAGLLAGWLAAAAILAVASGCTYFNTFYFAKKYYAQAERSVRRSESDKLPPDAAQKYDEAIKQCAKVLAHHAGSRWTDDAIYLMGASYYGKREFDTALKKFDELIANYPQSDLVPKAEFMSGLCHFERRNYEMMQAAFERTLQRKPKFERRDEILFTLGQAAKARRDWREAIRHYRELVRVFPGSERGQEAFLLIGDMYFDQGLVDSALIAYDELVRRAETEKAYREAVIKSSDTLVRLGRADAAIRQLDKLLPDDTGSNRPAEDWPASVRIHLAQAHNSRGEHDEALRLLREATTLYPGSSHAAEAQFQIGYTYEVHMDSLAAARKAYDQVSTMGSRSVFREQALLRAKDLQQLETLAEAGGADSVAGSDLAMASLKIAELQLFSQNRVEEARTKYREVVELYPGTPAAPRAAYALAWIRLHRVEGERDSALADFRRVVESYPASRAARGAVGLLVMEDADTSGLTAILASVEPDTLEAEPAPVDEKPEEEAAQVDSMPPMPRFGGASDVNAVEQGGEEMDGPGLSRLRRPGGRDDPRPVESVDGIDSLASRRRFLPPSQEAPLPRQDSLAPPPDSLPPPQGSPVPPPDTLPSWPDTLPPPDSLPPLPELPPLPDTLPLPESPRPPDQLPPPPPGDDPPDSGVREP